MYINRRRWALITLVVGVLMAGFLIKGLTWMAWMHRYAGPARANPAIIAPGSETTLDKDRTAREPYAPYWRGESRWQPPPPMQYWLYRHERRRGLNVSSLILGGSLMALGFWLLRRDAGNDLTHDPPPGGDNPTVV